MPTIYRALQSQIKEAVAILKNSGVDAAVRHANGIQMNESVTKAILRLYKDVGVLYANQTLKEINSQKGFGFDKEWINQIIEYFRLYLLQKAVIPISQTTRDFILQVLNDGISQGLGINEIARQMLGSELTLMRARMIARTEIGKAVFVGEELAKDKTAFKTQEEWVAANDHRTRHSHHQVDGDTVLSGGKFKVPVYRGKVQIGFEYMTGPGDPTASAGNVINCRCKRAITAQRDENGRLIFKR